MQTINVWKLASNGTNERKAEAVEAVSGTDTEQLLEDVLTSSPGLLLPDLWLVGRQTPTPGGPLDLLGVDEDGRLVVFELKRGTLTRDAVAQAIDYASYLAELQPEDLCQLISENSGRLGIEKIDFRQRYETEYPEQSVAEIGAPRIVLVGLGVDERAKRMVQFLAKCDLDISLITFHGFKLGPETLLARQVEVQNQNPIGVGGGGSAKARKADLDKVLTDLGIQQNYEELVAATKKGLGASIYQRANPTGYSFYLREVAASGGPTFRAYLSLYVPEDRDGKVQILLQARAVDAAGPDSLQALAKAMGTAFERKAAGYGEIWIDGRKPASSYSESITALAQRIAAGWKSKMESQDQAGPEETVS